MAFTDYGLGIPTVFNTKFGGGGDKNNVAGKVAAYSAGPIPNYSGKPEDIIQSPTGESPLADLPQYGGRGGSQQAAAYYAAQDFFHMFGRNPTAQELSMLTPAYLSGDPNIANVTGGRAQVAQYYQNLASDPARLEAIKQKQYQADAPKYYESINSQFQSTLGRQATADEKQHFGALQASGNIDAYTIGQFLNTLPEAVQKQDKEFRQNLTGELQKSDTQYYQEQILPALQQQAAQQGRSLDSSGISNALALAAQQQNRQREGFLSNLSAAQYGGSQALAQQNYQQAYGNYQNLQNYSMLRSNQLQDAFTTRTNQLSDYQMQKQAFDDYVRRLGKRPSGMGSLAGGLLGLGLGSLSANPYGMFMGYQIGSGLGGAAESSFGGGY